MSPSVNGPAVRTGYVSVKEDGFASWLWGKKWLVLREEVLSIHRNEVRQFKRQRNKLSIPNLFRRYPMNSRRHKLAQYG